MKPYENWIAIFFNLSQYVFLGACMLAIYFWNIRKGKKSFFNHRKLEDPIPMDFQTSNRLETQKQNQTKKNSQSQTQQKKNKNSKKPQLQLGGIKTDGPPHEILGVQPDANLTEIQKAYRDKIKIYHPDRVGRPDSQAWKDAQKIAEAINHAKETMIKAHQAKTRNRSER